MTTTTELQPLHKEHGKVLTPISPSRPSLSPLQRSLELTDEGRGTLKPWNPSPSAVFPVHGMGGIDNYDYNDDYSNNTTRPRTRSTQHNNNNKHKSSNNEYITSPMNDEENDNNNNSLVHSPVGCKFASDVLTCRGKGGQCVTDQKKSAGALSLSGRIVGVRSTTTPQP